MRFSDLQTIGRPEFGGSQIRAQNHTAPRNNGSDATSRRHHRHGKATRGQRLRSIVERSDLGVREGVVHDIIVILGLN